MKISNLRKNTKGSKKPLETAVQKSICDYLAIRKHFFWRSNNIPVFAQGRFRAMPKYSMNGVPDIILVKDGKFVGIEVKRKGGKQSDSQIRFQKQLELNGGKYILAESIDDIIKNGL